ncbi:MAG: serpin family protein [Polyangiaceae bacterium]
MDTHRFLRFASLPLLMAAAACSADAGGSGSNPQTQPPTSTPSTTVPSARSEKPREKTPAATPNDVAALTGDGRAFGAKLYGALRKDPALTKKNIFLSPHSIHTAFAMLYAGAQGSTATSMASALDYSLPQDRLHAAMNALDLALASRATAQSNGSGSDGKGFRLAVANSLWSEKDFVFETPYLDTLAVNYDAGVNLLDFRHDPAAAADTINRWIEEKTENRIQKMLSSLDPSTELVLVNAVYFNAAWRLPFEASATANATFHGLDGDTSVPTMKSGSMYGRYAKTKDYDAVALPYEGGAVEMIAIAPTVGTLDAFESGFDRAAFDAVVDGLKGGQIDLTIPRFTIKGDTISLKPALSAFGMAEAFTERANFHGVTTQEGFHVFDAAHKAFVKVDEKGTEAAAATAIVAGTTSVGPTPEPLHVDRPFLFAIRDVPTGAMLFLGRVTAPE